MRMLSWESEKMNVAKIAAIVLIVAGSLGLLYGGFGYTTETHEATLGPLELSVTDRKAVNIPVWAGLVTVAVGGGLLLAGSRIN